MPSTSLPPASPGAGDAATLAAARAQVRAPAVGLIAWGAIGVLASLAMAIEAVLDPARGRTELERVRERVLEKSDLSGWPRDALVSALDALVAVGESMVHPGIWLVAAALWTLVSAVAIVAGRRMLELQSRGLAMAASVLVMIPCLTPCWCCCPSFLLGLPLGLWSLIALQHRESELAFAALAARRH